MVLAPLEIQSLLEENAFNKQEQIQGSRVILEQVQSAVTACRAGRPKGAGAQKEEELFKLRPKGS